MPMSEILLSSLTNRPTLCHFKQRDIAKLNSVLSGNDMKTVTNALISSRLDSCNLGVSGCWPDIFVSPARGHITLTTSQIQNWFQLFLKPYMGWHPYTLQKLPIDTFRTSLPFFVVIVLFFCYWCHIYLFISHHLSDIMCFLLVSITDFLLQYWEIEK